jgi:biopolymer transport protein ExbD
MRLRRKEQTVDSIDISPLIDCVFLLLIFFMVTTTFVKDMKLELDRPSAASASMVNEEKVIRVYIDSNREVYVDNQPIKVWAMQSKLRDLLRSSTKKAVLVVSDSEIPVESLIDVIDECKMSGAEDVAVSTNKELGV